MIAHWLLLLIGLLIGALIGYIIGCLIVMVGIYKMLNKGLLKYDLQKLYESQGMRFTR